MSVNKAPAARLSNIRNPRFVTVNGEVFPWGWNPKGLGYRDANNMPSLTDDEIVAAVNAGKSFASPTGRLSGGLFDADIDPWFTLSSEMQLRSGWLRISGG